jgi:hypothetical protein
VTFIKLYIPQNDSVPQNNSGQENAAQDTAGAARKKREKQKRLEERRKKKKEEEEARKKKQEQRLLQQVKKDSIARTDSVAKVKTWLTDPISKDTSEAVSLFTGHEHAPVKFEPIPHEKPHSLWLFALVFTAYTIYVSLRVLYSKRFRQEMGAFFTSRTVSQMMREEYALTNRVSLGLSLLFIMLVSLFLYQVFVYFGYFGAENFTGPQFYTRICGVITVVFAFKLVAVRILGVVFKMEAAANEYIFNIFLHHKALGLFLFPVTVAIAFMKNAPVRHLIITGWVIIAIVLVYRTLRALLGGVQTGGISKYYLFVYLCTLEILPLIVIIKVFISQT